MRLAQLDALRCLAVVLVLGRHLPALPPAPAGPVDAGLGAWQWCGWVGVDLFFVLSGFLVSGLVFREYKKTGHFRVGRFLCRRGLKIYPPFYVMLAVTLVLAPTLGRRYTARDVAGEVVFLQNYVGRVWNHTWTLAVEEHFYLLLALTAVVLLRVARPDPFRYVPALVAATAATALALRVGFAAAKPPNYTTHLYTHFRIDSLAFGVLLGYWTYFRPDRIAALSRRRWLLAAVSAALVAPCVVLPIDDFFSKTVGLTLLYCGFGGLVLFALRGSGDGRLVRLVGRVGADSYSIYLWHMPVLDVVVWAVAAATGDPFDRLPEAARWAAYAVYLGGSLVVGIVLARVVEWPVLAWRDRRFPSVTGSPPTGTTT